MMAGVAHSLHSLSEHTGALWAITIDKNEDGWRVSLLPFAEKNSQNIPDMSILSQWCLWVFSLTHVLSARWRGQGIDFEAFTYWQLFFTLVNTMCCVVCWIFFHGARREEVWWMNMWCTTPGKCKGVLTMCLSSKTWFTISFYIASWQLQIICGSEEGLCTLLINYSTLRQERRQIHACMMQTQTDIKDVTKAGGE